FAWWLAWLAILATGVVGNYLDGSAVTLVDYSMAMRCDILFCLSIIVAGVLAIYLMVRISQRQWQRYLAVAHDE
ncbi:MAG TPA: hypothetical protein VFV87_02275, partial [Pirellulaceae bacterium]|nr:hypothetical protein [Pirellulaceae bacterium]